MDIGKLSEKERTALYSHDDCTVMNNIFVTFNFGFGL